MILNVLSNLNHSMIQKQQQQKAVEDLNCLGVPEYVSTGFENRSASSQLDWLECVLPLEEFVRQYLCLLVTSVGLQIPFVLRMEKEQAVITTSNVIGFSRFVLLHIYGTCFPWSFLVALKVAITSAFLQYPIFAWDFNWFRKQTCGFSFVL